ncbi:MAG: RHS repeat-associated core domain-containing protein, partial [Planctomycetota bacterium]
VERKSNGTDVDLRVEYQYDAWGNRTQRSVDLNGDAFGDATVTKFLLDGSDVRADLATDGSLITQYLLGDRVDQRLARIEMTGSHFGQSWNLTDNLGSLRAVVDSIGTVVDALDYDAFGNITAETDPTYRGRYAWTGREIEAEVHLQFNRARYYDPSIGRWISRDPMGFDAGDSNLYRYVRNSPTNFNDPSGYQAVVQSTYEEGVGIKSAIEKMELMPAPDNKKGWVIGSKGGGTFNFAFSKYYIGKYNYRGQEKFGAYVVIQVTPATDDAKNQKFDTFHMMQLVRYSNNNNGKTELLEPQNNFQKQISGWNDPNSEQRGWRFDLTEKQGPLISNRQVFANSDKGIRCYDPPQISPAKLPFGKQFITLVFGSYKAGAKKNTEFIGEIHWGFRVDKDGKISADPSGASNVVPPEFGPAFERWKKESKSDVDYFKTIEYLK